MESTIEKHTFSEWRRLKGMTQKEVGDKCKVHENTIRYWEQNPSSIKWTSAVAFAEALGVSIYNIILPSDTTKCNI